MAESKVQPETDWATTPLSTDFPGRLITPIFVNAYYVTLQNQAQARFTFGEVVFSNIGPNYTSAMVMPNEVAIEMAKAVLRLAVKQKVLSLDDLRKELSSLEAEFGPLA